MFFFHFGVHSRNPLAIDSMRSPMGNLIDLKWNWVWVAAMIHSRVEFNSNLSPFGCKWWLHVPRYGNRLFEPTYGSWGVKPWLCRDIRRNQKGDNFGKKIQNWKKPKVWLTGDNCVSDERKRTFSKSINV